MSEILEFPNEISREAIHAADAFIDVAKRKEPSILDYFGDKKDLRNRAKNAMLKVFRMRVETYRDVAVPKFNQYRKRNLSITESIESIYSSEYAHFGDGKSLLDDIKRHRGLIREMVRTHRMTGCEFPNNRSFEEVADIVWRSYCAKAFKDAGF